MLHQPASKTICLQSCGQLELVTRCPLMLPTPHPCRLLRIRAGWVRFGKTRSFFTEFAYPRSDLSVWKDRMALAGKDQIKAFSLSESDNHIIWILFRHKIHFLVQGLNKKQNVSEKRDSSMHEQQIRDHKNRIWHRGRSRPRSPKWEFF